MESSSETISLPKSMLRGKTAAVGDVVRLKVVSDDGESLTVEYAEEPAKEKPMGVEAMASEFAESE